MSGSPIHCCGTSATVGGITLRALGADVRTTDSIVAEGEILTPIGSAPAAADLQQPVLLRGGQTKRNIVREKIDDAVVADVRAHAVVRSFETQDERVIYRPGNVGVIPPANRCSLLHGASATGEGIEQAWAREQLTVDRATGAEPFFLQGCLLNIHPDANPARMAALVAAHIIQEQYLRESGFPATDGAPRMKKESAVFLIV